LIYVTLGSSGPLRALPTILGALATLDVDVLLATAGRIELPRLPANARSAAFVRGDLAAARASLVVCNGGASTAYQALTAGTPVVGVPLNLDQYLVMDAIERAGAGILLRSGTVTEAIVRVAVLRALHDPDLQAGARRMAAGMRSLDAPTEFSRVVLDATRSSGLFPGKLR
jgi:UDP:flavonoid glycosyltransferase YjiC (YdhE family)